MTTEMDLSILTNFIPMFADKSTFPPTSAILFKINKTNFEYDYEFAV